MSAKDCCNRRLEAATISEILHLSGQGNLTFITEKSGKSQGILKTDVCGNHAIGDKLLVFSDKIVHIWISSQKPRVCQKSGGNPGVNARQSSQLVLLPKPKRRHSRQESSWISLFCKANASIVPGKFAKSHACSEAERERRA